MLLLSVSEAKVCSVDIDEMSLADDDWEAEPDTTSGRRDTHTKDPVDLKLDAFSGSLSVP